MDKGLFLTNKKITLKVLRQLMKEVAIEARETAMIADKALEDKVRQELSDLIKQYNGNS